MSHELTIEITTENLCKEIKFCDYTLEFTPSGASGSLIFGGSPAAMNGYGWETNLSLNDLTSTMLTAVSLDGSISQSLFSGTDFLPAIPGNGIGVVETVSVGATYQAFVDGVAIMPLVTATSTDVEEFISAIIDAVNAATSVPTNYQAFAYNNAFVIYTEDITGAAANGLVIAETIAGWTGNGMGTLLNGFGNGTGRCIVVPNAIGDGIYEMLYQVSNGTTIIEKTVMFYNDCAIRECLMMKIVNASKESGNCCNGCGSGLSKDKINWLYAQLDATKVMFDEGQYACADNILRGLLSKCDTLCNNC